MDSAPIQSELPRRPLRPQELERLKQRALEEPVPDLSTTDRRGVSLRGMNLCGANLRNADLTGADLEDANVDGADFREAIITAGQWPISLSRF